MADFDLKSYRPLSISARHAVALVCFEKFCEKFDLDHPLITQMLDHQWEWSTLNSDRFDDWAEKKPQLVWVALGEEYSEEFEVYLISKEIDPVEFRELIESAVEIVDWNLFGNVDEEKSFEFLNQVLEISAKYDISPPPASKFVNSSFKENHGWGKKLTPEERDQWRF